MPNRSLSVPTQILPMNSTFACSLCSMTFHQKTCLSNHLGMHNSVKIKKDKKERNEVCDICQKTFTDIVNLKSHRKIHTDQKPFACEVCQKSFSQKSYLVRHYKTHSKEKLYGCETCGKRFKDPKNWKKHCRIHTDEGGYTCNICSKRFPYSSTLTMHIRTHTFEKPYVCPECGKAFSYRASLRLHKMTHEKPYACELCKVRFWDESSMLTHYNNHKGESLTCKTCQRSFVSKATLEEHVKIHSEVTVECNVCHMTFPSETHLAIHSQTHSKGINFIYVEESGASSNTPTYVYVSGGNRQEEEVIDEKPKRFRKSAFPFKKKPFTCDICRQGFFEEALLTRHFMKHVEGKGSICDVCNIVFPFVTHLVQHKRTHTGEKPYKCPKDGCTKAFAQNSLLTVHIKMYHNKERPFVCDVCKKGFDRKVSWTKHIATHTVFVCDVCLKTFSRSSRLKLHKKTKHGDEQSDVCPVCEEVYSCPADVAMHMKMHDDKDQPQGSNHPNPFKCDVCNKTFKFHESLLVHREKHGNLQPTACPICNDIFSCPADLVIHSKTHSGGYPQQKTNPGSAAIQQEKNL